VLQLWGVYQLMEIRTGLLVIRLQCMLTQLVGRDEEHRYRNNGVPVKDSRLAGEMNQAQRLLLISDKPGKTEIKYLKVSTRTRE